MSYAAQDFGRRFDSAFVSATRNYSPREIPLFRALSATLTGLGSHFAVEEYHGSSRQVRFSGNGTHARRSARCELSDLLIVVFSPATKVARLTYLQAKSERRIARNLCAHPLSANLEQWFLLASRPLIAGVGAFCPPNDLLSGALLPSVGTFAFFYRRGSTFQTFYASASHLSPAAGSTGRYGKVIAQGKCQVTTVNGHEECLAACGNASFAANLYDMRIGTPVSPSLPATSGVCTWLGHVLRSLISDAEAKDRPTDVARQLANALGEARDATQGSRTIGFGARSLIVVKSDTDGHSRELHVTRKRG